jgi:hypothetical protein
MGAPARSATSRQLRLNETAPGGEAPGAKSSGGKLKMVTKPFLRRAIHG